MKKGIILSLVFFALVSALAPGVFAQASWFRNPVRDVERRIDRKLDKDEIGVVEYIVALYAVKFGRARSGDSYGKAVRSMNAKEYDHAIEKAAKAADSKAILVLFKAGKLGEKGIKTLFVLLGDAADDIQKFLDEKAAEFDKKH